MRGICGWRLILEDGTKIMYQDKGQAAGLSITLPTGTTEHYMQYARQQPPCFSLDPLELFDFAELVVAEIEPDTMRVVHLTGRTQLYLADGAFHDSCTAPHVSSD